MKSLTWQFLSLFTVMLRVSAASQEAKSAGVGAYPPPEPGTYNLPIIKRAADGAVLDAQGTPRRLRDLTRDRVTILSFIYTRCAAATACPRATGVLNELHELSADDPVLSTQLRLVSMSFDPGHDTPKTMAGYAAVAQARPKAAEWHFITTKSETDLKPILEEFGQAVDQKKDPASPTGPFNHILRVFLLDAQGRIRNIYSSGTLDVRLVLADIKTLLMEAEK